MAPFRGWQGAALLLLVAFALRMGDFGNPVIHVDEQYYLLVGDRMWHGALPYLTVWDRKPIGLFLAYAAIRLLPGDGILAYQIVATLCAGATAMLVRAGARRLGAGERAAWGAGALYLLGLSLLGGRGGQAPVLYNLPVAAAGLLTIRLATLRDPRRIVGSGLAACLLAGIAIQMKYTPAVEGAWFGLAHLWALRRAGVGGRRIAIAGIAWATAGLAPTLAAIAFYAFKGALPAFWFANVTSIALRPGYPWDQLAMRLLGIAATLSPVILAAALTLRRWRGDAATGLAIGWLGAAVLGFLAIGTFFDHYALPLLAPLTVLAAPALDRVPRLLAGTLAAALILFAVERALLPDDAPGARRVAAIVRANSGDECPYVFIGDTITYVLADTCLPTAYAFPNLLAYATERGATGIDEAAEVRRILARRPPVIVTSTRRLSIWNPASLHAVKAALARDYRLVFTTPRAGWRTAVYLRRDRPLSMPDQARISATDTASPISASTSTVGQST